MAARGRYIVMLGYAGVNLALTLAELHRNEVQKRFPKHFLKQESELRRVINGLSEWTGVSQKQCSESPVPELRKSQCFSETEFLLLRENEVFPSLWKIAEGLNAGLDVELRKIPIPQFVIELCELFDVNPYVNTTALENRKSFGFFSSEIQSGHENTAERMKHEAGTAGTEDVLTYGLLIVTDEPEEVLASAEEKQIPSAVIGRLTDMNDRVVRNGEIIRYLTPEG